MQLLVVLSISFALLHRIICETWNYGDLGPDVWSDEYPLCSGRSQSPINIRTACTTYQSFTPFQFSSTYNLTNNFTITNNGHTIVGTYNGTESSSLKLTGGSLHGTYEFVNFHLHWGENYKSGSEHQVNGVKYAGEIHFVHINPETRNIAVLGIFIQSSRNIDTNETLEKSENLTTDEWARYFTVADDLQEITNSTILNLNLASLMGGNLNDFWRYEGSLTTPPCTEGIIWTMFKTPIVFTENDLESFRKNLFYEDYRGPQPLYDRIVYRNFLKEISSLIPDYKCCSNNSANDQNSYLFVFIGFFIATFI